MTAINRMAKERFQILVYQSLYYHLKAAETEEEFSLELAKVSRALDLSISKWSWRTDLFNWFDNRYIGGEFPISKYLFDEGVRQIVSQFVLEGIDLTEVSEEYAKALQQEGLYATFKRLAYSSEGLF